MSRQNEAARLPRVFETLIVSDSGDGAERLKVAVRGNSPISLIEGWLRNR